MAADITHPAAAIAGLISFLSPCVLPLVPPYLCYMAGASLEQLASGPKSRNPALIAFPALAFVAGFSTVFISLGWGASSIGIVLRQYMDWLSIAAGLAIIAMGLHFLGVFRIGLLYREARFSGGGAGIGGSYVMGLAFAFGWTPCIGPVLGAILALAGTQDSAQQGALLLASYSAGLGIPFFLAALFVSPFMQFLARFKAHLVLVEKLMGVLLVITGIAFLSGFMQTFSFWLLERFPGLGALG